MDWLTPADADELAALLAERVGDGSPLLPTGAEGPPETFPGSAAAEGDDAAEGRPGASGNGAAAALSTATLAGLRDLRPRDLTVVAGAGTRVPELLRELAAEGVWVPLGGPALGMSVGGAVAAAPAGPFDESYGDLKRQLLACGMTGWDGERLRWGRAVMKDVAGYSMVRSATGAFGRTGVVRRATFRLWPAPETLAAPTLVADRGGTDADSAPDGLAVAGALAASDADASVRPDAAVWSWSPDGPAGGRLEVRLVGTGASVALRLEKLRARADGWGAGLEGGEPGPFDPLAAGGSPDGAGGALEGAPAAGLPPAGPRRDPRVSLLALRPGRGGFEAAARRLLRELDGRTVAAEGYPMAGHLRVAYRRPAGADPPDGGLPREAGDAPLRLERGSAAELAAADARRGAAVRRLEGRVLDELGGRPRHWRSSYL